MQEQTKILPSFFSLLPGRLHDKQLAATGRYKLILLGLFTIAYFLFYVFPNFHSFSEPRPLPMLALERAIPFMPWTFLVYLSEFLLIAITICLIRRRADFNAFARQAFGALFITGTIFMLFPTIYARPAYPPESNVVIAFAMNFIKQVDMPTNCFPSMHIAITAIAVYALRFLKPGLLLFFAFWGLCIFASTLTTKQHYIVDILGGLAIAFLVVILEAHLFRNPGSAPELFLKKKLSPVEVREMG